VARTSSSSRTIVLPDLRPAIDIVNGDFTFHRRPELAAPRYRRTAAPGNPVDTGIDWPHRPTWSSSPHPFKAIGLFQSDWDLLEQSCSRG
jgi:hypothetical protein